MLTGEGLECQVQEFTREAQSSGGVVNTAIALAAVKGIVLVKDVYMLRQNGGYLNLTREWAKRLLSRMELGKHKATTTVKITAEVFEELKVQFVTEIETVSMLEGIPT